MRKSELARRKMVACLWLIMGSFIGFFVGDIASKLESQDYILALFIVYFCVQVVVLAASFVYSIQYEDHLIDEGHRPRPPWM